jgi:hypothetical protein
MEWPMRSSAQGIARGARGDLAQLRLERLRFCKGQVQEHESAPGVDGDRVQADRSLVESGRAGHMRGGDQAAVQVVGPLVIRAHDAAAGADPALHRHPRGGGGAGDAAELSAAVTAYIVEGAQRSAGVAHQQNAFTDDVEQLVVAGRGEFFLAADAQPLAREDPFLLELENAHVAIPPRGQRPLEPGNGSDFTVHRAQPSLGSADPMYMSGSLATIGASRLYKGACGSWSNSRA